MIDENALAHTLHYRGFTGSIEYSEADEAPARYFGKILDIKDLVTYKADSIAELNSEFISVIDDYVLLEAMLNVY